MVEFENLWQIFEAYTDDGIDIPLYERFNDNDDLELYIDNVYGIFLSETQETLLRSKILEYLKNPPVDSNDRYHRFEKLLTES